MKQLFYFIALAFLITSCEDVIEVELPEEPPRLVVDALIRVDTTEAFTEARVRITQTSSFFDTPQPVAVSQITMLNVDNPGGGGPGDTGVLDEVGEGVYSKFFPTDELMQDEFLLQVNLDGVIYIATTRYVPAVPIDDLRQGTGTIFDDTDTEIIISFTDEPNRNDFYLFDFDFENFLVSEDQFYQGQQFEFSYFYEDELLPGDELEISILGIDESLFNYMDLLIDQAEGGFGPFQTPVATVRGNFINATDIDNDEVFDNVGNPNNFALGYFAIVQEFKRSFTIQ